MASAAVHHMQLLCLQAVLAEQSMKHLAHTDLGHMDIPFVHSPATMQLSYLIQNLTAASATQQYTMVCCSEAPYIADPAMQGPVDPQGPKYTSLRYISSTKQLPVFISFYVWRTQHRLF